MKRLFQVGNEFFEKKADAKAARGEFVPGESGKQGHYPRTVAKGPDHWAYGKAFRNAS